MAITEFGWVFIYICAFGLTDYINEKYIKTEKSYILFYFIIGIAGFYIVKRATDAEAIKIKEKKILKKLKKKLKYNFSLLF